MVKVNTFGLTKAVYETIFDMIVPTNHDKTLIFSSSTFWGNPALIIGNGICEFSL